MSENYSQYITNIVNSYISKKSLCMLLLASSILFYTMAKNHQNKIPTFYTLTISILLILYAVALGLFGLYEFVFHVEEIIKVSANSKFSGDLVHFQNIHYFYLSAGTLFLFLLIYIAYVLIRFD